MKYLNILDCDIADGEGIRVTLFVSGCSHKCPKCQNPESWDYNNGYDFTEETLNEILQLLNRDYVDGLTLSGGDPLFKNNREEVLNICKTIKEKLPNKNIWLYTGYDYNEIKDLEIINYIDYVVDGKYIDSLRDVTLPFRGSKNQNIIKINHS